MNRSLGPPASAGGESSSVMGAINMEHPTNITFRISAEYRRILWYEWAGAVALIVLMIAFDPRLPPSADRPPLSERVTVVAVLLSVGLIAQTFATYSYRLVLNETGIHRRRFGLWDHWPWSDFENGLVEQDALGQFVNRARRWGTRTLGFPYAAEPVALTIKQQCLAKWNPPPIKLPMRFRIRVSRRRKGEVTAEGLTLRDRRTGEKRTHPWSQLQRAVIFKNFAKEHVCSRVHLSFTTGHWMIDFPPHVGLQSNYQLPAMIERYAPADRIIIVPMREPPRTSHARRLALAEIRSQLWRERRESRTRFKWGIAWLGLVLFPLWAWDHWPQNGVEWLATVIAFVLVFGGFFAALAALHTGASNIVRKRLNAQRDHLLNDSPPAPGSETGGPSADNVQT
ncbi:MAG: hypothetical protein ACYC26_13705 [Phycisphaerales bacterium]